MHVLTSASTWTAQAMLRKDCLFFETYLEQMGVTFQVGHHGVQQDGHTKGRQPHQGACMGKQHTHRMCRKARLRRARQSENMSTLHSCCPMCAPYCVCGALSNNVAARVVCTRASADASSSLHCCDRCAICPRSAAACNNAGGWQAHGRSVNDA